MHNFFLSSCSINFDFLYNSITMSCVGSYINTLVSCILHDLFVPVCSVQGGGREDGVAKR